MSNKLKLHFQYSDGSYDVVEVDEKDTVEITRIHENNNKIRRDKYLRQKMESRYTIEQVEAIIGHELPSDEPNAFEKMILEEKERMAEYALGLRDTAKLTLTKTQLSVYELMVEKNYSSNEVAVALNCTVRNINKILLNAKSRICEFYSNYPDILEFFPGLLKYLRD